MPAQPLRFAMLVFLAVEGEAPRDRLLATFWPGRRGSRARHSLNQTLYQLRGALGQEAVVTRGDVIAIGGNVRVDVAGLEDDLAAGGAEALGRYTAAFLAGFPPPTPPFAAWAAALRTRLAALHADARRAQVRGLLEAGDRTDAIEAARAWSAAESPPAEGEAVLRSLLDDRPAQAATVFPARRVPPPSRAGLRWPRAAVALLALLLAGAAITLGPRRQAAAVPAIGIVPFTGETLPADAAAPHRRLLRTLIRIAGRPATELAQVSPPPPGWRADRAADVLRAAAEHGITYLVTGETALPGAPLSVELWHVPSGARILRLAAIPDEPPSDALARTAFALRRAIADHEGAQANASAAGAPYPSPGAALDATRSPAAAGHYLLGDALLADGDLRGARAAFSAAARADPSFGPAWTRGALTDAFAADPEALARTVSAALDRGAYLQPQDRAVLLALASLARGLPDDAVRGLEEHVATGGRPDALAAFALALHAAAPLRAVSADSLAAAFARAHAADPALAPLAGPVLEPRSRLRGLRALTATFLSGDRIARAVALDSLRWYDGDSLTTAFHIAAGAARLGAADSIATLLQQSIRTPSERATAAALRLTAIAGMGRWEEATRAWSLSAGPEGDGFIIAAVLAGWPADFLATAALRRAATEAESPGPAAPSPALRTLAHHASILGDSARIRAIDRRLVAPGYSDPELVALRGALAARLQLLAGDTATAARSLADAVRHLPWPHDPRRPLACLPAQRLVAARLLLLTGRRAHADRLARAFLATPCIADPLFLPAARSLVLSGENN